MDMTTRNGVGGGDRGGSEDTQQRLIDEYIASLDEQHRIVYEIAKDHLETSFDIEKSIGYLQWLSKRRG